MITFFAIIFLVNGVAGAGWFPYKMTQGYRYERIPFGMGIVGFALAVATIWVAAEAWGHQSGLLLGLAFVVSLIMDGIYNAVRGSAY